MGHRGRARSRCDRGPGQHHRARMAHQVSCGRRPGKGHRDCASSRCDRGRRRHRRVRIARWTRWAGRGRQDGARGCGNLVIGNLAGRLVACRKAGSRNAFRWKWARRLAGGRNVCGRAGGAVVAGPGNVGEAGAGRSTGVQRIMAGGNFAGRLGGGGTPGKYGENGLSRARSALVVIGVSAAQGYCHAVILASSSGNDNRFPATLRKSTQRNRMAVVRSGYCA